MSDTTNMIKSGFKPVKTDVLGRVRISNEDRELILDAFETSHLSGATFARHCGVNYQTFASWAQKRRRQRGESSLQESKKPMPDNGKIEHSLVELELPAAREDNKLKMPEVELPGGARIKLDERCDLKLAAAFLLELERSRQC